MSVCVFSTLHTGSPDLVLEAGHAEIQHVQQSVELGDGQVREPLLQHHLICVLQHPKQADEQAAAGLCREGAVLTRGLGEGGGTPLNT